MCVCVCPGLLGALSVYKLEGVKRKSWVFVVAESVFVLFTLVEGFRFAFSIHNFDNVFGVGGWAIFLVFGVLMPYVVIFFMQVR